MKTRTESNKPHIAVITGLSGAGKSIAINSIEDFGGFCVDNLPPALITRFLKLIKPSGYSHKLIALGIDLRAGEFIESLFKNLKKTEKMGYESSIIFLSADEKTIIRRYSESRRRHPLSAGTHKENLSETIKKEAETLEPLRAKADMIIDTSELSPWDLKSRLREILFKDGAEKMAVNLIAFGFKYGLPESADMIIDTRFLPNPHYNEKLSALDGTDKEIKEYVFSSKESLHFLKKYKALLEFLIPNYIKEGKAYLNIGVGCTGGRHRSVAVTEKLEIFLKEKGYSVFSTFNDIDK